MTGLHADVNTHKLTVSAGHHMSSVPRSSAAPNRPGTQEVREEENAESGAAVMARLQLVLGPGLCNLALPHRTGGLCTVMPQNSSIPSQLV